MYNTCLPLYAALFLKLKWNLVSLLSKSHRLHVVLKLFVFYVLCSEIICITCSEMHFPHWCDFSESFLVSFDLPRLSPHLCCLPPVAATPAFCFVSSCSNWAHLYWLISFVLFSIGFLEAYLLSLYSAALLCGNWQTMSSDWSKVEPSIHVPTSLFLTPLLPV